MIFPFSQYIKIFTRYLKKFEFFCEKRFLISPSVFGRFVLLRLEERSINRYIQAQLFVIRSAVHIRAIS